MLSGEHEFHHFHKKYIFLLLDNCFVFLLPPGCLCVMFGTICNSKLKRQMKTACAYFATAISDYSMQHSPS